MLGGGALVYIPSCASLSLSSSLFFLRSDKWRRIPKELHESLADDVDWCGGNACFLVVPKPFSITEQELTNA